MSGMESIRLILRCRGSRLLTVLCLAASTVYVAGCSETVTQPTTPSINAAKESTDTAEYSGKKAAGASSKPLPEGNVKSQLGKGGAP